MTKAAFRGMGVWSRVATLVLAVAALILAAAPAHPVPGRPAPAPPVSAVPAAAVPVGAVPAAAGGGIGVIAASLRNDPVYTVPEAADVL
ncbi:hypothetical protein, partial [Streptomyces sp. SID3343]|uniref:hypothetical protein n=1 Tax=Streptomyces sp. SID3343 TaxID=2690260 RepID=UPI0019252E14